jgi:YidC/Oxa1 family membrane protein insertase
MDIIYTVISWILLRWHDLWSKILPEGEVLGTNWRWILAIISLVITVRVILFPVFVKQIKSQRAMQALQPQVKALQEKHKGDRESMQKELMELYRKEKANPLMGCLPMFLQIPVFLGLFHTLKRLAPGRADKWKVLYGWTADQFDSASGAKLFGSPIAAHFTSTADELQKLGGTTLGVKITAGVLVAVMIGTTFLTSRQMILKTGWSEDPQQRMIQKLMLYGIPFSLLISGGIFPIGVVIYWTTQNLFSLGQQFWVLRKYPPPPMAGRMAAGTPKGSSGPSGKAGTGTPKKASGKSLNGKPNLSKKNTEETPADTIGRALAPRPGAKPNNPKKRGPARRPAG